MKKILVSIITILFLVSVFELPAYATDDNSKTVFYIDKGSVSISDESVSGYDAQGNPETTLNKNGYLITQTTSTTVIDYTISISGTNTVEINNLKMVLSGAYDRAIGIESSGNVTLILSGINILQSGNNRAAIDISVSAALTIEGNGTVYAYSTGQAGIGGGNGKSNGTLTINSGKIFSYGGTNGYGAGIGGGSGGKGGTITINGGFVFAVGGNSSAGIGGGNMKTGGIITINSGTVTATGGTDGAGIGGGYMGSAGTITISGGSVKAVAGANATDIGNGSASTATQAALKNSQGENVYLCKINCLSSDSEFDMAYVDTLNSTDIIKYSHSEDTALYFYLTAGEHIAVIKQSGNKTIYAQVTSSATSSSSLINPFELSGGVYLNDNSNNYIMGCENSLSEDSAYFCISSLTNNFKRTFSKNAVNGGTGSQEELYYNNQLIDKYTYIIYGDVDGDSKYDATDSIIVSAIKQGMLSENDVSSAGYFASDCNRDGSINDFDVENLVQGGLFLSSITQTK